MIKVIVKDALKKASLRLQDSCERPQFEAELLLAFFLQKSRVWLHTYSDKKVANIEWYFALIERREANEPYEYIVESVSFYDMDLYIKSGVLIPRRETEILIDKVAKLIEKNSINQIAEIGVGSGAISIVLARKFKDLKIVATDLYDTPLKVARQNIQSFNLTNQIKLIKSNLIDKVEDKIDLVVSNPPYIANDFKLESNVIDYEPKEALFGGEIGDELLKDIILEVQKRDIKFLACEMGYDQRESLIEFFRIHNIDNYQFYKDLAGLDRGFIVEF
jgi:release factor glutamine methyltransferase